MTSVTADRSASKSSRPAFDDFIYPIAPELTDATAYFAGSGSVADVGGRRRSESAAHHLERRPGHCPGRIERRGERSAIRVGRRGAEERRRAAKHSARETAHNRARAGKESRNGLAGSTHDGADRRHGPPGVARALHDHRFLRMNDDITTLVGVVVIVRVMRVRVVFMRIVLLRRCWSGDGERQRRHPDRRRRTEEEC